MSTRARTRAVTTASTSNVPPVSPTATEKKPKSSARKTAKSTQSESDQVEKENVKGKTVKTLSNPPSKPPTAAAKWKLQRSTPEVYCTCQEGDDGSPMVQCGECNIWYHFRCVDLKEEDAEDIHVYICTTCVTTSRRRTTMTWEGPDSLELDNPPAKKLVNKRFKRDSPAPPSESEEEPSSEDEYIVEDPKVKRRLRRLSVSSESESEASDDAKPRRHRIRTVSGSPAPGALKRKSHQASHTPPPKRKKADATVPEDDPTRKYCLGKLRDLFRDIYLRYPHVRVPDPSREDQTIEISKLLTELSEGEKAALVDESKDFADELEKCVFETYSEPDKHHQPSAGSNYKDRFRMLQFNLSKFDRVVIHQRIASNEISPREISVMSSTDLANEETKQSIKIAEKEALEYSILTPTAVPRAKITHKGLEDIEVVHGEITTQQDEERSRKEEEERRERERMARLRAQARQRTASLSVPPESPVVAQQQQWGGPPPVPLHAMASDVAASSSPPSMYANEPSSITPTLAQLIPESVEPELNLAEFINMDDEGPTSVPSQPTSAHIPTSPAEESTSPSANSPISPTGISPFAPKTGQSHSASFDLNSLWNASKKDSPSPPPVEEFTATASPQVVATDDKDVIMDIESGGADDQDFDMFLEEKDVPATSPEAQQAVLDALPQVWAGKINMPLDSTTQQEIPVVARQIGGRPLEHDSALWKTLFPSDLLRIEGRVPVENSSKFLLQMRMNASRELIGVAFSPASESSDAGFRILSDFLIAKGRHGLIFPWGNRQKDHHPGRELYIIPLLSSETLPEYMELLDDLHLPKVRNANLLIGIWVLIKGKLAPPIPPPAPAIPTFPPVPQGAQVPLQITPFPLPSHSPPAPPLPAAIAAEVASLTPEQIQLMIQTLTANGTMPLPSMPISQHPPQQPQRQPQQPPMHAPRSMMPPQSHVPYHTSPQPWDNPSQGYGGVYPPPVSPTQHNYARSAPLSWDRPTDAPQSGSVIYERNHEHPDGRGWRGTGASRRGRGRSSDGPQKPDAGWPRRPRHDGGPGPGSPNPRW